ncbi:MAG: diadenylate cyclase CdaA [Candidatus Omnitrophota bacterium]
MQFMTHWKMVLEILILWYTIYTVLLLIKGTRTEQLLKGLVIIGVIFVATQQLHLDAINWVITRLVPISIIALVVIFQPELRRGLARLGQFGLYQEDMEVIERISRAAVTLSTKRTGALIAIEREAGLKVYIESGILLDGQVSEELLVSIFMPQTPLHDGAVIIQRDRIVAAGCLLPLSQEANISKSLGTRHRAAIGLSEETDGVCIVVSEETGAISVAIGGKLMRDVKESELREILKGIFYKPKRARKQ